MTASTRRLEYIPLDEVRPADRNPRRHGIDGIRTSIARFGYATPALRDVPKPSRSEAHPTMKPVALIVPMLSNSCPVRGLVYEPFGGSGSTLIAAQRLGMRAAVVELDPRFADVICRRFQEHTGITPVLESTGEPHDFTGGD